MRATRLPPMRNTTGPHRARHCFQAPGHDAGQGRSGISGTRGGRLTHWSALARFGVPEMRPCGRVAHYMDTFPEVTPFTRWRKSGPFSVLRLPRRHRSTPDTGYSASGHRTRSRGIGASRPRLRFCNPGSGVGCVRINDHGNRSAQFRTHSTASMPARNSLRPHPLRGARRARKCVVWPDR